MKKQKKIKTKTNKTKQLKENQTKTNNKQIVPATIFTILLFIGLGFFEPKTSELISFSIHKSLFVVLKIILSAVLFLNLYFYRSEKTKNISKYVFLAFLLFYLSFSILIKLDFAETFFQEHPYLYFLRKFLILPTTVFGILTISFYKNKINKHIDTIFKRKAPNKVETKQNSILQRIKKEGALYITFLIMIFGIGFFTLSHHITHYDIFEDEFQMMSAATGYYNTGEFKRWDYANKEIIEDGNYGVEPQIWLLSTAFNFFGVSKLTARSISVFMGLIFIFLAYLITRYFIKNKIIALLVPLAIIFSPEFLHLFRYIRMYALVIPLTTIILWLLHKGITTENKIKFKIEKIDDWISKYFNFNIIYLIISLPLIFINYKLHQVSLITMPSLYLYVIYLAFAERQLKYYIMTGIGTSVLIIAILFFKKLIPTNVMTFFEGRDWLYLDWLFSYPFSINFTIIILLSGLSLFIWVKNKTFKRNLALLYILIGLTFVFFAMIASYGGHDFRFVSHVVPFVILLTIYLLYLITKSIYKQWLLSILLSFLVLNIAVSYNKGFESLYEENHFRPWYSVAYQTIIDNFNPEDEVVFGQYLKGYYAKEIYRNGKVVDMRARKEFTLDSLKKYQAIYPKGWITWATYKSWHFEPNVIQYINNNFRKIHGQFIDSTNIEVFYYDKSMIPGTKEYAKKNQNVFSTNAYLSFNRDFSISVWLKTSVRTPNIPFIFRKVENDSITVKNYNDSINSGISFMLPDEVESINSGNIFDGKWHHLVFYKMANYSLNKYGIYIDNKKVTEKTFLNNSDAENLLVISTLFNGQMQDFRVFKSVLSAKQVNAIYNNGNMNLSEELFDGETTFSPYKHFTVK